MISAKSQIKPVGSVVLRSEDAMIVETILKSHATVQQHLDALARELQGVQGERAQIEQSAQELGKLFMLSGKYQIEGADADAAFVFVRQPNGAVRMSVQPGAPEEKAEA